MAVTTKVTSEWKTYINSVTRPSIVAFQQGSYIKTVRVTFNAVIDWDNTIIIPRPRTNNENVNVNLALTVYRDSSNGKVAFIRCTNFGTTASGDFVLDVQVLSRVPISFTVTND